MVFKGNDKPIINMNKHLASMKADGGKRAKSSPFQQAPYKDTKGAPIETKKKPTRKEIDESFKYGDGPESAKYAFQESKDFPSDVIDHKMKKNSKAKSDFDKQKGKITTYGKHNNPKRKDIGKDFYYKSDGTKISSDKVDEGSLSKTKKGKKGTYVDVEPGGPHGDRLYLKSPLNQTKFNPDGSVDSTPKGMKTTKASGLSWGAVAKNKKDGGDDRYSAVKGMQDRHATNEFHKNQRDEASNTDLGGGGMRPTLG